MKYAIIENHICVNVIVADEAFATKIGAVPLPDGYGIGDSYDGGVWTSNKPPYIPPEDDPDVSDIAEKAQAYDILMGVSEI